MPVYPPATPGTTSNTSRAFRSRSQLFVVPWKTHALEKKSNVLSSAINFSLEYLEILNETIIQNSFLSRNKSSRRKKRGRMEKSCVCTSFSPIFIEAGGLQGMKPINTDCGARIWEHVAQRLVNSSSFHFRIEKGERVHLRVVTRASWLSRRLASASVTLFHVRTYLEYVSGTDEQISTV